MVLNFFFLSLGTFGYSMHITGVCVECIQIHKEGMGNTSNSKNSIILEFQYLVPLFWALGQNITQAYN